MRQLCDHRRRRRMLSVAAVYACSLLAPHWRRVHRQPPPTSNQAAATDTQSREHTHTERARGFWLRTLDRLTFSHYSSWSPFVYETAALSSLFLAASSALSPIKYYSCSCSCCCWGWGWLGRDLTLTELMSTGGRMDAGRGVGSECNCLSFAAVDLSSGYVMEG